MLEKLLPSEDASIESPDRRWFLGKLAQLGVLVTSATLSAACAHGEEPALASGKKATEGKYPNVKLSPGRRMFERPAWLREKGAHVYFENRYCIAVGDAYMGKDEAIAWATASDEAFDLLLAEQIENYITDLNGEFYIDLETKILYYPLKARVKRLTSTYI